MTSAEGRQQSNSVSGHVEGQNIVIGGTQFVGRDLSIVVGQGPGTEDLRRTLQEQIDLLTAALRSVSAAQAADDDVAEVVLAAEDAVRETQAEQVDASRLRMRGAALKRAAAKLAAVAPAVLEFANQVAATIAKFG